MSGDERQREHDAKRTKEQPWRRWYWTERWRKQAKRFLRDNPLCVMCKDQGIVEAATVCDHVEPHKGNLDKFWGGPFQPLCKTHHDRDKKRIEMGHPFQVIGDDGWPVDRA